MKPLQLQNISGLQAPTIGLQSPTLPATIGAAETGIDMNSIMNLMLIMVVMVMMMKMMGQVTAEAK